MGLRQEVVEQGRLATAEEARQHLGFATVGTISTAVSFDAGLHRHRHAEVHRVHVLGHDSERKELDKGFGEGRRRSRGELPRVLLPAPRGFPRPAGALRSSHHFFAVVVRRSSTSFDVDEGAAKCECVVGVSPSSSLAFRFAGMHALSRDAPQQ